jgi:predicted secreted protein
MCMQSVDVLTMSREELEQLALQRVCACLYYDLADTLEETPDEDLIKVIRHEYECDSCNLSE